MADKNVDLYDESKHPDAVHLVVNAVEDCERGYHDAFVEKVERRYDAYRALSSQAAGETEKDEDWHSNVTTPVRAAHLRGNDRDDAGAEAELRREAPATPRGDARHGHRSG